MVFISDVSAYTDFKTFCGTFCGIAKHTITGGKGVSVVVAIFVAEDWFGLACHFVVVYEKLGTVDWDNPSVLFAKPLMTFDCLFRYSEM